MKRLHVFITLLTIGILTAFLFGFTSNTDTHEGIVNVRVFEGYGFCGSEMIIVYEDGRIEEIKLKSVKTCYRTIHFGEVNPKLNAIGKEGYRLFATTTTSNDLGIVTDYIFIKK